MFCVALTKLPLASANHFECCDLKAACDTEFCAYFTRCDTKHREILLREERGIRKALIINDLSSE